MIHRQHGKSNLHHTYPAAEERGQVFPECLFFHPTIPPFHHPTIPPSHHPTFLPFHHPTIPQFHHSTIPPRIRLLQPYFGLLRRPHNVTDALLLKASQNPVRRVRQRIFSSICNPYQQLVIPDLAPAPAGRLINTTFSSLKSVVSNHAITSSANHGARQEPPLIFHKSCCHELPQSFPNQPAPVNAMP